MKPAQFLPVLCASRHGMRHQQPSGPSTRAAILSSLFVRLRKTARLAVGTAFAAATLCAPVNAQTPSGSVGSTVSTYNVQVALPAGGTVSNVSVLTLGIANLDFKQNSTGDGCTNQSFTAGQKCTVSVTFAPTAPGTRVGAVVLKASNNTVIGTAYLSGIGMGGLGVMTPGTMMTVAGSGDWQQLFDGGPAISADLDLPQSIAVDGSGNLYIADSVHSRIRRVDAKTQNITTIAGNGTLGYAGDNQPAGQSVLSTPSSVAFDGAGNLYIADTGNNVVRMISSSTATTPGDLSTAVITTVAGSGTAGFAGDGGLATSGQFSTPMGVTISAAGELYIADTKNHRIRKVALDGTLSTVAGNGLPGTAPGSGTYTGDGGAAPSAGLNSPFAVAFDKNGNIFIPDSGNNVVREVTTNGIITTFAGTGTAGFSGDSGAASQANFNAPSGVIIDAAGNVYIADTQNNRIRKVSVVNQNVITIAGNGVGKFLGDGASALLAGIYGPYGLALDAQGDLYAADYFDHRIREIPSSLAIQNFPTAIREGQTTPPQAQSLENDGNVALSLTSLAPDQNAAFDGPTTTCFTSITSLNTDDTCAVGAEFAPTQAGNPLTGNINIGSNSSNAPLDIEVVGQSLARNAAQITLTSTANPSAYGQSVSFVASVTTGAGDLTGNVTFFDGTTPLASPVTLSGGTATFSTGALTVGLHTITATYNGDVTHLAVTSTAVAQVVNESTTTTLTTSQNPVPLNANLTLTAVVSAKAGAAAPQGTVLFYDGTTPIGTGAITNGGVASMTTSTLTAGSHALTAVYSGLPTSNIQGSTSQVINESVQAQSSTQLISSSNPSIYGNPVNLIATVSSVGNGASAVGTVQFLDGGKPIGTATLQNGTAQLTVSNLATGTHVLTAAYEPSVANAGSTSGPVSQTVQQTSTATAPNYGPQPAIAGKAVSISAAVKVTTGAGVPTGKVTFTDATTVLGTATLSGSGVATINANLSAGTHAIVATYSGDANDGASTSGTLSLPVVLATTNLNLASSANPAIVESPITFTANVSGNGGLPTGNVTFTADGNVLGTQPLDGSGNATITTSALLVGTHPVTASYAGDANDAGSVSTTLNENVTPIATTTNLGTAATSISNSTLVLVASVVANANGPVPTGTVTFYNGSTVLGVGTVDATGVATLNPDINSGSLNVIAKYSGDSIHSASTSSQITVSSGGLGFDVDMSAWTVNVQSSQNQTLTMTLTSTNGFADTLGLGCSGLPARMNCHFSNDQVALSANGKQTTQLTIDTGDPLSGGTEVSQNSNNSMRPLYAGMILPAALVSGLLLWRNRRKYPILFAVFAAVLLSSAGVGLTGCGSLNMNSVAPGTYVIQVTGTGVNTNVTRTVNVTVQVTK